MHPWPTCSFATSYCNLHSPPSSLISSFIGGSVAKREKEKGEKWERRTEMRSEEVCLCYLTKVKENGREILSCTLKPWVQHSIKCIQVYMTWRPTLFYLALHCFVLLLVLRRLLISLKVMCGVLVTMKKGGLEDNLWVRHGHEFEKNRCKKAVVHHPWHVWGDSHDTEKELRTAGLGACSDSEPTQSCSLLSLPIRNEWWVLTSREWRWVRQSGCLLTENGVGQEWMGV